VPVAREGRPKGRRCSLGMRLALAWPAAASGYSAVAGCAPAPARVAAAIGPASDSNERLASGSSWKAWHGDGGGWRRAVAKQRLWRSARARPPWRARPRQIADREGERVRERMGEREEEGQGARPPFLEHGCKVASSGDKERARDARPHHAAAHA
jgi:hypothetical protein